MKKRFLVALLLLVNVIFINAQEFIVDGIKYNVLDTEAKTVEIVPIEKDDFGIGIIPSCNEGDLILSNTIRNNDVTYTLTSIGKDAFRGCQNITKVTIPNSVTNIGDSAFLVSDLEEIIIPNSIKNIGLGAFYGCTNLKDVILPEGLGKISSSTFIYCENLESVTIPSSVKTIEYDAFVKCLKLKKIIVNNEFPININLNVFEGEVDKTDISQITLKVPKGSKSAYEIAAIWKDFGTIVEEGTLNTELVFTQQGFGLNITNNQLTIHNSKNMAVEEIAIFNTSGKQVKNNFTPIVNITDLTSGVYIVAIKTTNGIATKKFVKQ